MKRVIWFWLPPLAYMIAIFSVSSLPDPQIGVETPDYVLHALEYFLLTLLLIRLFLSRQPSRSTSRTVIQWHQACVVGLIIAIAYGITDEIHQYFIPGRHCSLSDVVADTGGALLAYSVAALDYWLLSRCAGWKGFSKRFSISYAAYRFQ